MPDQPLQPFAPPTGVLESLHLAGVVSPAQLLGWVLLAVFAFWALYTLVAIYHWLRYSHSTLVAIPAIALHLGVSFLLITTLML